MAEKQWCTAAECFLEATVLIRDKAYCTTDGREANGGWL